MRHYDHIVIVSVYQQTKDDLDNHKNTIAQLELMQVPHLELEGSYKGVKEKSILLPVKFKRIAEMLARDYNQETYLESHNDRMTELVYSGGHSIRIGTLAEVTESEALESGNYSYNPITKVYYGVRS